MVDVVPTGLAILAVSLFGVALGAMAFGDFQVAGFSFLSASLVIFIRESRYGEQSSG